MFSVVLPVGLLRIMSSN